MNPYPLMLKPSDGTFDRAAQNEWEVEQYGIPLVAYVPKTELATPLSYVVDIEITKGETQRLTYYYITEDEEIAHFLAWAKDLTALGYDLETSGLWAMDDKIATLQLGNPKAPDPRAYVFDVRGLSRQALEPVFTILRHPKILKLGQNVRFECKWTQFHWGVGVRYVWDTQVSEMLLRAGLWNAKNTSSYQAKGEDRAAYKHTSMAALTRRYLEIDIDKDHDLRTSFYKTPIGEHSLRQIVYAASDVIYPFYIAALQRTELKARKLDTVAKIEMGVIPVLADMELTGFYIDVRKWRALWQEAVKERAETERALDLIMLGMQPDLFGGAIADVRPIYTGTKKPQPLNYSSAAQVKWAIKQYCKSIHWPVHILTTPKEVATVKAEYGRDWLEKHPAKTEADIPDWVIPEAKYCVLLKADKNVLVLAKCRNQLPAQLVDLLVKYSKYDIRCDTFGNEFLKKHVRADTGCIHTEFHQAVTATGRLSSSPNLQNIPSGKDYRSCFIPKPGYGFVICDYSQIEPRITAQTSKDPNYLKTFLDDDDLYLTVAEAMLGYRPDIHSDDPAVRAAAKVERKIFKTVVLALAYNMGKWKLRDRLTLALEEEIMKGNIPAPTFDYASELWDKFFEVHAKVREIQTVCIEQAQPLIHLKNERGEVTQIVPNSRRIWDQFLGAEVTWVTAPCGRKRFFPPDAKNCYTEAPNVPPQSGSATITKAAAWMIQQEIDANGWDAHLVNLVHDEIVVMVRLDQAEAFAPIVKRLMEQAGQHYCPDVPIKAEYPEDCTTGVVLYWAKAVTHEEDEAVRELLEAA